MAIFVPQANEAADAKAREALRLLDAARPAPLDASIDAEVGAPQPVTAIPIFAPRIGKRTALGSARQTGWRYLVTNSDRVGIVDVATDGAAATLLVGASDVAERVARAARALERAVENDPHDYEMRLLDLSLVGDSVIWLFSARHADRFFTYSDTPHELSVDAVRKTLRDGARAIRAGAGGHDPEAGG